eukprot:Gb_03473 [translate_table: standard]
MSFAMATMEFASSFQHHYKFKNQKQICVRVFVDRTLATPAVQTQHTQKPEDIPKEPFDQRGIPLDCNSCASLLQACTDIKSLKQVHALMFITGLEQNNFLETKLLNMYTMCGSMNNARLVFDKMNKQNVFLWNAMIRGYATNGPCEETLSLYNQMQHAGIQPDKYTFPFLLKACSGLSALQEGKEIHDDIVRFGFESDAFVVNSLITMYTKCGSVEIGRQLFDKMCNRNGVSWNAMIAGYAQNGHAEEALALFHQMQLEDMVPSTVTMVSVLQACADLRALQQGKWIHDYISKRGFESNIFVANSLIAMYAKCGSIEAARNVFYKMSKRDVISWNAMIDGYVQNGHDNEAFILFKQMQLGDVKPNSVTIVNVLSACSHLAALQEGMWVHEYIIRRGLESDVFVGNSLVAMYAKCGSIEIAHQLFDKMPEKNAVSWNAMITGYAQNGHANEALTLFYQMHQADMTSDAITMVSVLQACAHLGALQQGKWIHDYIIQSGLESDVFVGTALIDMYSKCGRTEVAHQVFQKMPTRDVVSWNAMIAGHTQSAHANEALILFHQMQLAGTGPNSVTIVSVLLACAHLAALQQGKRIHGYTIKSGLESNELVGTALIDMYAKCGSLEIARHYFDKMLNRNVVSWSAMIDGYGMHGFGDDALELFFQMQQTGMKPNHITFVSVLSACSHTGLVDEGWHYFDSMVQDYCIAPRVEHYACMVDLLGRAGHLDEAQDFIEKMPLEPSACVWASLLGACRIHSNIELGERVAEHLFDLDPKNAGCYVLLSNIYAAVGRWDDSEKVRTIMKGRGLKATPGCSLIEVNNMIHAFFVGDRSHPQSDKIYALLQTLAGQMKEAGYMPNTNFVLHDVDKEVVEHMLSSHSEKLAIAFGLINTSPGSPIRIAKNLRVCGDCHSATKFISKIARREIIMRDANRFHNFKDGFCSCGDYW